MKKQIKFNRIHGFSVDQCREVENWTLFKIDTGVVWGRIFL